MEAPRLALGLAGCALVVAAPEVSMLLLALLVEEAVTAGGHSTSGVSPLASWGSGLYDARFGGFHVIVVIAALGAIASFLRRRPTLPTTPALLVLALIGWTMVLALAQGQGIRGAVAASAPFLVLASAFVVGASLGSSSRLTRNATFAFVAALALKAVLGVLIYARGESLLVGQNSVSYYDSAISFLGAMAALAALLTRTRSDRRNIVAALAGITVVAFSIRRNVVVAAIGVIAILGLLPRTRRDLIRVGAALFAAFALFSVFEPATLRAAGSSLSQAVDVVRGGTSDASAQGHVHDFVAGVRLVKSSPILGAGVFAAAQTGFVVDASSNLYIHDEYLQTWARFGLPGVVLLVALLTIGTRMSIGVVRSPSRVFWQMLCALGLIGLPIALIFFPDVTTAFRYDILFGTFVGSVSVVRGDAGV